MAVNILLIVTRGSFSRYFYQRQQRGAFEVQPLDLYTHPQWQINIVQDYERDGNVTSCQRRRQTTQKQHYRIRIRIRFIRHVCYTNTEFTVAGRCKH